ncbi:hypothetical protein EI94DRAFT_1773923 [Lactarius quietus]|nr:hypothetical protein EI94DRAFT_1773923 [Lactarius quietus]
MLAPMVLPTRLYALKHGAKLVWGPEMHKRAMFTCHPIEKPYLIFQAGSADPDLAVQAARLVVDDVSGIRLLPKQEDTLALVERIVNTGINCLTIHCRTRNMRPRERALVHRLKEIVDFVKGLGRDVAVIENGDCVGFEDARRIRALTGADSVMIATAAEANPTVFSPHPLTTSRTRSFYPTSASYCKYLDNHWASTKFCISQFKGRKSANKALRSAS